MSPSGSGPCRCRAGGSQRPGVTSTPPATNLGGCNGLRMAEPPLAATSTQALVGSMVAPGYSAGQGEVNQDHHQPHQGGPDGASHLQPLRGPGQGEHSGSPSPSGWPLALPSSPLLLGLSLA